MKIIKHGKKPRVFRGACQQCGCRIECSANETKIMTDRDSKPGGNRYVKCPDCKNYIWVK